MPLDTHQLAPATWQLPPQQQTATATLRATCCDLVLTKNTKNGRPLVAKIATQMAATLAATATASGIEAAADWLTIFMLGKIKRNFLIKLFAALGHAADGIKCVQF